MKYLEFVLSENDVIYLYENTFDDNDKPCKKPTLRIENIEGKLYTCILPRFFVVEKNAKIATFTSKENMRISTADTGCDIIIKKDKKTAEVSINEFDHELDFPHFTLSQYNEHIGMNVSRKFNAKIDRNHQWAVSAIQKILDKLNFDPDFLFEESSEDSISILFNSLTKQRKQRLDNVEKSTTEQME